MRDNLVEYENFFGRPYCYGNSGCLSGITGEIVVCEDISLKFVACDNIVVETQGVPE